MSREFERYLKRERRKETGIIISKLKKLTVDNVRSAFSTRQMYVFYALGLETKLMAGESFDSTVLDKIISKSGVDTSDMLNCFQEYYQSKIHGDGAEERMKRILCLNMFACEGYNGLQLVRVMSLILAMFLIDTERWESLPSFTRNEFVQGALLFDYVTKPEIISLSRVDNVEWMDVFKSDQLTDDGIKQFYAHEGVAINPVYFNQDLLMAGSCTLIMCLSMFKLNEKSKMTNKLIKIINTLNVRIQKLDDKIEDSKVSINKSKKSIAEREKSLSAGNKEKAELFDSLGKANHTIFTLQNRVNVLEAKLNMAESALSKEELKEIEQLSDIPEEEVDSSVDLSSVCLVIDYHKDHYENWLPCFSWAKDKSDIKLLERYDLMVFLSSEISHRTYEKVKDWCIVNNKRYITTARLNKNLIVEDIKKARV